MSPPSLAGRVLLALIFIVAGYGKLTGLAGTAGYIASKGCRCRPCWRWAQACSNSSAASRSPWASRPAGPRWRWPCSRSWPP
ncbi:MAG: DoxX family protein [Rubrivivax sp.]